MPMKLSLHLPSKDVVELRNQFAANGFFDEEQPDELAAVDPLIISFGIAALGVVAAWIVKNRSKITSTLEIDIRRPDGTHEHISFRVDSSKSMSEAKVLEALNIAISPRVSNMDESGSKIE